MTHKFPPVTANGRINFALVSLISKKGRSGDRLALLLTSAMGRKPDAGFGWKPDIGHCVEHL
jgi:hypothetical protein